MKNKIIFLLALLGISVFVYLIIKLGIKSDEMAWEKYMEFYLFTVWVMGFVSILTLILMIFPLFNNKIVYIILTTVLLVLLLFTVLMPPKYDTILKEQIEKRESQNRR